jgi:hypothetical protein
MRVPWDIVLEVLDLIDFAHARREDSQRVATLRSCSEVTSGWRHRSLQGLFRRMHIFESDEHSRRAPLSVLGLDVVLHRARFAKFANSPHNGLLQHARILLFQSDRLGQSAISFLWELQGLKAAISNLTTLRLPSMFSAGAVADCALLRGAKILISKLSVLDLSNCKFGSFALLHALLSSCINARHISISKVLLVWDLSGDEDPTYEQPLPREPWSNPAWSLCLPRCERLDISGLLSADALACVSAAPMMTALTASGTLTMLCHLFKHAHGRPWLSNHLVAIQLDLDTATPTGWSSLSRVQRISETFSR